MSHLTSSKNRKPSVLSKRISAAGFGAVAAAALILSAGSADAASSDQKLIQAKLTPLNVYLNPKAGQAPASLEQIKQAIIAVITENANNKKVKPGVIAGEALKSIALSDLNEDVGKEIAIALTQALAATPATEVVGTLVGDAAKTAGVGKGAILEYIPAFVAEALDSNADVLLAAKAAASSNTVVANIFAGRASELNDAAKTDLVESAVTDKSAAKAIVEIAREVSAQVSDTALFTEELSAKLIEAKKTTTILKVVPAVVSLNVEDASAITEKLLNSSNAQAATLKSTVVKNLAGYAKSVSAVADIEQISEVGAQLALQIGANGNKTSLAAGLAKTLATAIFSKPIPTEYSLTAESGALTINNRRDEIAEVAAYVVGGIINNTALQAKDYKSLDATVLGIIKNVIAGSKTTNKALKAVTTEFAKAEVKEKLIVDIVGSVALTLDSTAISETVKARVEAYLLKNVKSLAGKSTTLKTDLENAIKVAFGSAEDTTGLRAKFENGTLFGSSTQFSVGSLVDAETEIRNY